MSTSELDARIEQLRDLLLQHRADRDPRDHATLQFHLGTALLEAGRWTHAAAALRVAAGLFEAEGMLVERAKALNMLGAAYRSAGVQDAAEAAFRAAVDLFERHEQVLEGAAAAYNLGLIARDVGHHDEAIGAFEAAWHRFAEAEVPAQASAAAREAGITRLQSGSAALARGPLETAVELATEAGDRTALGAAANALGLTLLALDEPKDAVAAFTTAIGAYPRSVQPDAYAMARANLALAHERAGDAARARLAARQALSIGEADGPVRAQAQELVDRLGSHESDLVDVAGRSDEHDRQRELRHELTRLDTADAGERRRHARAWLAGQVTRVDAVELAADYLAVLLELPPESMHRLLRSLVEATLAARADVQDAFRGQIARATARFPAPQMLRLQGALDQAANDAGDTGAWR